MPVELDSIKMQYWMMPSDLPKEKADLIQMAMQMRPELPFRKRN